jgi:hypothetical protein
VSPHQGGEKKPATDSSIHECNISHILYEEFGEYFGTWGNVDRNLIGIGYAGMQRGT